MKNLTISLFFALLLFASCSPKVIPSIVKTYPAISEDSPVTVFSQGERVPSNAELLGTVSVADPGTATKCDSTTVINLIKKEATKVGGDGVIITDHKKPSFWGSSCHQMTATVLRLPETFSYEEMTMNTDTASYFVVPKTPKAERKLPAFRANANIGYGYRTAKAASNLNNFEKDFLNGLRSGLTWDLSFNYFFNDNYGIGLIYSDFQASNSVYAQKDGTSGNLKEKDHITFIGPEFLMRFPSSDLKWIFNLNIGLGYMGLNQHLTFDANKTYMKIDGSTFGAEFLLGADYLITPNWAIGANISSIGGVVKKITKDENGQKSTITAESANEGEGLGHLKLSLGVKYCF